MLLEFLIVENGYLVKRIVCKNTMKNLIVFVVGSDKKKKRNIVKNIQGWHFLMQCATISFLENK